MAEKISGCYNSLCDFHSPFRCSVRFWIDSSETTVELRPWPSPEPPTSSFPTGGRNQTRPRESGTDRSSREKALEKKLPVMRPIASQQTPHRLRLAPSYRLISFNFYADLVNLSTAR